MGGGASLLRDELTRDEAKALVPESKWDDGWDDRYFAEGKRVARELIPQTQSFFKKNIILKIVN